MSTFWQAWRKEIIRGAVLFFAVLGVWLFARHMMAHVRQTVANNLPTALGELRSAFDPEAEGGHGGPRMTAAPLTYRPNVPPHPSAGLPTTPRTTPPTPPPRTS